MMRALSLGELAKEALEKRWPAKVIGVTSGGVFVIVKDQWVLFLTYSPFRAPGTINLERSLTDLKENENGSIVMLAPDRVVFPDTGLVVQVNGADVWNGRKSGFYSMDYRSGIADRLQRAAMRAYEQKGAQGLAPALRWLAGKGEAELVGDLSEKILAGLVKMRIAIKEKQTNNLLEAIDSIVGYGRGLTPASDDCIAGILLTLNRWKEDFGNGFDLPALNEAVVRLAQAKTTSLSTTIIHAATLGQGDERILSILDGIICGDYDEIQAIQNLVNMGHSSGVDSLVGIAVVLTA